jgi:hypothetical protein
MFKSTGTKKIDVNYEDVILEWKMLEQPLLEDQECGDPELFNKLLLNIKKRNGG